MSSIFLGIAAINKPLCQGPLRVRLAKELSVGRVNLSPEEFFLIKELAVAVILFVTYPTVNADIVMGWIGLGVVGGYMVPEFWLKGRIKKVKAVIVKELPDAIDLLGLCVNAGLDFMLSLKWVVEKSAPSVMIDELNTVLQEINVGKTRRDAIRDLAVRYELPDLSTFSRTLIQADKMGTSVTEALNILSEDMRIARYRRGEQLALKAPMKMLVPLLLFIFPVVGILVAGPILLDFMENSPFEQMGGR
jgi:tight adherence protein C